MNSFRAFMLLLVGSNILSITFDWLPEPVNLSIVGQAASIGAVLGSAAAFTMNRLGKNVDMRTYALLGSMFAGLFGILVWLLGAASAIFIS